MLGLYGVAIILSNPMVAFGLFYVVLAVWFVLAYVSLRFGSMDHRIAARALLVAVVVWVLAVVPAFLFLMGVAALMWYAAELASTALAAVVMAARAADIAASNRRAETLRRIGLASGLTTALLILAPIATYLIPDFEVAAIFHPILFYLPYLIMLVTAGISVASFGLVPAYARERSDTTPRI